MLATQVRPSQDTIAHLDSFDDARLDRFLVDQAIEAPESWESWSPTTKIAWLKLHLEIPGAATIADPHEFGADRSSFSQASARSRSKVSLMTSIAALANPIEGKVIHGDREGNLTPFPPVATWGSKNARASGVAVAKDAEIEQPDPLHFLIHETDCLNEKDALASVGKLANQSEVTLFRLGGVLANLKAKGWHKAYGSFKAFVQTEHDIPYRQAAHWMGIYRRLADSKIPWEKAQKVGWSKLKEIASVITADNVDQWIKVASESATPQLIALVAKHKKAGAQQAIADQSGEVATRMTFKVDAAQKEAIHNAIEKAKAEAGTQIAAVALEKICSDYLLGASFKREAQEMGLEACLRLIEEAYPNTRLKVAFVDVDARVA